MYPIRFLIVLCALCMVHAGYGYEPRNLLQQHAKLTDIWKWVSTDKSWVPYPIYTDRVGWDRLTASLKSDYIKKGEESLKYEWRIVKATDYLEFERTGSRGAMQNPFNKNVHTLSNLLMAELCEGKGRFIDQIVNGVWLFSEMTSWAASAHLPGPQKSGRVLPDHREHVIDLGGSDLASLLSWTYYFLKDEFDKIDPVIAERLKYTLKEKVINTYMQRDDFWWQAFRLQPGGMVNNWNPWCNFNVLSCLLLVEDDERIMAEGVYRTMQSVDHFINYNNLDGACEEGPSYWGHAAGKLYDYLQLLGYATKDRVNIFNEPIIRNMGEYIGRSYVGDGWVVNFADASAKGGGDAVLIYRYGKSINSLEMQQFAAYLYRRPDNNTFPMHIGRDFFRALESFDVLSGLSATKPALPQFSALWYAETEFCYMKDGERVFVAYKGGYNNESHNHNDIGTFNLYVQQIPFFIDVGVGTYTKKTFSKDRYSIWTMQSSYHNLPKINGYDQVYGAKYKSNTPVFNEQKQEFSLDISKAYPEEAGIREWNRLYRLQQNKLHIIEKYDIQNPTTHNEINFMTWVEPVVKKQGEVYLHSDGIGVRLKFDKTFSVHIEQIPIEDKRLSDVWGEKVFKIVLKSKTLRKKGHHTFEIEIL